MAKGKLYLIPTPIGDRPVWDVLPASNRTVIDSIDYFIGRGYPFGAPFP